jgi:hypothetical protein
MNVTVFAKRLLLYLVIGFVIILIWWSPDQTAASARDFLSTVGNTVLTLYDRAATFLKGLSGRNGT